MFGLTKSKAAAGLDIGSTSVKAVELKATGKSYRVVAMASEPVPPDAIVDGAIMDGGAVADAIRRLFDNNKGFKAKDVAVSLSGSAVIVKKISLPQMSQEELAEKAELHPVYISTLERELKTISIDALVRIARALKVNVTDLCDGF